MSFRNSQPTIPEPAVVRLDGELDWRPFDIPGGSEPVRVASLHPAQPTLAVRFPSGWERAETGSYAADEEFIVVDGAIEMNGERFSSGWWVHVPAGAERRSTCAPDGAVALARFAGPARWTPGRVRKDTSPIGARAIASSPDGSQAWPLRDGSWVVRSALEGLSIPCDVEIVSVSDRAWAFVPMGAAMPALGAPWFCRTITS